MIKGMQPIDPSSRIMAIDPGVTCGFATCGFAEQDNKTFEQKFYIYDNFVQLLCNFAPDILVMEKYTMRHRDKTDFTAIEFIGLGRWVAETLGIPFILQIPALGKGYFTNDKLKHLGLYVPGKGHSMDALRHLLQFKMRMDIFDLNLLKE